MRLDELFFFLHLHLLSVSFPPPPPPVVYVESYNLHKERVSEEFWIFFSTHTQQKAKTFFVSHTSHVILLTHLSLSLSLKITLLCEDDDALKS